MLKRLVSTLPRSRAVVCRYKSTVQATSSVAMYGSDSPPPPPQKGFFGQAANFDNSAPENQARFERWRWVLDKLGFFNQEDTLMRQSGAMLHSCVNQAAQPHFYKAMSLEPDFRGQQAMLMIHVWMVHRRLMGDATSGKLMQEQMFDRLWDETIVRLRHQNINELMVNKYLKEVQQLCFSACVAYDKGLREGMKGLIDPLQQQLFNEEGDDARKKDASTMAQYMLTQLSVLQKTPFDQVLIGSIPWRNPVFVSNDNSTISLAQKQEIIGCRFGHEWRSALDLSGKLFYWNTRTRMSSWELPDDVTTTH